MASVNPTRAAVISGVSPFDAARFTLAPLPIRNFVQRSSLRAIAMFSAVSPLTLRVLTIVGRLLSSSVALSPSRARTAVRNGSASETY